MLANIASQLAALTPVTATPGRKFVQARGALEQESLTSGFDRKFQVLIEQIQLHDGSGLRGIPNQQVQKLTVAIEIGYVTGGDYATTHNRIVEDWHQISHELSKPANYAANQWGFIPQSFNIDRIDPQYWIGIGRSLITFRHIGS